MVTFTKTFTFKEVSPQTFLNLREKQADGRTAFDHLPEDTKAKVLSLMSAKQQAIIQGPNAAIDDSEIYQDDYVAKQEEEFIQPTPGTSRANLLQNLPPEIRNQIVEKLSPGQRALLQQELYDKAGFSGMLIYKVLKFLMTLFLDSKVEVKISKQVDPYFDINTTKFDHEPGEPRVEVLDTFDDNPDSSSKPTPISQYGEVPTLGQKIKRWFK